MTEQPSTPPSAAPAQQPAPPAAAPPPAPAAQADPPRVAGKTGLVPEQETQLGDLLAARDAAAVAAGAIQLKVEAPHTALTYGGLTVGTEFTTVPASMVAAFTQAAAEAGVTITQQESES